MADPVRYTVDLSDRVQHLVRVTLTVPEDVTPGARLYLPVWTPGSYVVRDYVHHVQWLRATTADGDEVPLEPVGRSAWHLPDDVAGTVTVTYELYANDLTVRTNHVDDHHALLVGAATFLAVEGATDRRHVVTLPASDGERVHSLLPEGDDPDAYVADDFAHLVDAAFEVGDHPHVTWEVHGVPHRFVWAGHGGHPDLDRLAADATAITEQAAALFGGELPVERYTFLCVGWDEGGGGLEHRDGSVLQMPVRVFRSADTYASLQTVLAHEYLHLWNVKRLTPAALVAPDLEQPTHSESLWVAEGWTAYYDRLVPLRAGCWDLERFLDGQRDLLQRVEDTPGTRFQSLRRAGHEAWVKHYVRDENTPNAGTDYYAHGAVVAWSLDLTLRREDPDGDGLDAVLRLMWERFGRRGRGYTEADVEDAVAEVAGRELTDLFARHVAGRELPPIADLVGAVGLELAVAEPDEPVPPDLGVVTTEDERGVVLASVLRDRPAWRAGLTGRDRLVAIDGTTVARGRLAEVLRGHAGGDTVAVTVTRGPRLLTLPVTLDAPRIPRQLRPVAEPSNAERTAFGRWTGQELPER